MPYIVLGWKQFRVLHIPKGTETESVVTTNTNPISIVYPSGSSTDIR